MVGEILQEWRYLCIEGFPNIAQFSVVLFCFSFFVLRASDRFLLVKMDGGKLVMNGIFLVI